MKCAISRAITRAPTSLNAKVGPWKSSSADTPSSTGFSGIGKSRAVGKEPRQVLTTKSTAKVAVSDLDADFGKRAPRSDSTRDGLSSLRHVKSAVWRETREERRAEIARRRLAASADEPHARRSRSARRSATDRRNPEIGGPRQRPQTRRASPCQRPSRARSSRTSAKIDGPDPDRLHPSAPASIAARFTGRDPAPAARAWARRCDPRARGATARDHCETVPRPARRRWPIAGPRRRQRHRVAEHRSRRARVHLEVRVQQRARQAVGHREVDHVRRAARSRENESAVERRARRCPGAPPRSRPPRLPSRRRAARPAAPDVRAAR